MEFLKCSVTKILNVKNYFELNMTLVHKRSKLYYTSENLNVKSKTL